MYFILKHNEIPYNEFGWMCKEKAYPNANYDTIKVYRVLSSSGILEWDDCHLFEIIKKL